MQRWRQARELIWTEIVAAGGPYAVARRAGLHPTLLYAWRHGTKGLGEASIAALRAQVSAVADATWGAALALDQTKPGDRVTAVASGSETHPAVFVHAADSSGGSSGGSVDPLTRST